MNRRDWLSKVSLALAGSVLVSTGALEAVERATHRKVWALGPVPRDDAAFLQSLIDRGGVVRIPQGDYRLTRGLYIRQSGTHVNFQGAVLTAERSMNDGPMLTVSGPIQNVGIVHARFIMPEPLSHYESFALPHGPVLRMP